MAKIAEIKSRPGRKPPRDIFVAPDHALLEEIHREARVRKAKTEKAERELAKRQRVREKDDILLLQRLRAAEARRIHTERRHNRSSAIQALLDSGMSRQQIADALGLSYGAVVKTLWRWGRNACQK